MSEKKQIKKISSLRGMNDLFGFDSSRWQSWEELIRSIMDNFCYREIRTPVLESTELFKRGAGVSSDIVQKEMFTFQDQGEDSVSMRPEGTAPVVRALIENNFHLETAQNRVFYFGEMFRRERPQKGRTRQFYQYGAEIFLDETPFADCELIALQARIFHELGIQDFEIHLNSVGCVQCRPGYKQQLEAYISKLPEKLCEDCQKRTELNILRVFDCKKETCQRMLENAPLLIQHLCEPCERHHDEVRSTLKIMKIEYVDNPKIVRGLDYYSRTVFEFLGTGENLGSQNALGAGGRYDGLFEILGGKPTPAVGFASSFERLALAIKDQKNEFSAICYVAGVGSDLERRAGMALLDQLRSRGVKALCDFRKESFKAHMKSADRLNCKFSILIGADELSANSVKVKKLETGEERTFELNNTDKIIEEILK